MEVKEVSKLLDELFDIMVNENNYEETQQLMTEEICKTLEPYKESLSQSEYEQLRDILFYISHMARRSPLR
jgi:hypothetical protein